MFHSMSDNRKIRRRQRCPECNLRTDQHSLKVASPAILPSYPNERSSHVMTDEIIWEQYILEKCPCRPTESRFSESYCSQVGIFMATWVQCVLENPPCSGLHGGFRKTCCSQVFSCLAFSLYRQPLPSLSPDKIVNYTHMRQIEYGLRVGFYTRMQNVRRPGTQKAEPQPVFLSKLLRPLLLGRSSISCFSASRPGHVQRWCQRASHSPFPFAG